LTTFLELLLEPHEFIADRFLLSEQIRSLRDTSLPSLANPLHLLRRTLEIFLVVRNSKRRRMMAIA